MSSARRRGSAASAASSSVARGGDTAGDPANATAQHLVNDPRFVFRLKRKLSQLFCEKAGNGVISLDPEFVHADKCINDENFRVDLWGLKQFLHSCGTATRSLSERDLEVLFEIVRRDGMAEAGDGGGGGVPLEAELGGVRPSVDLAEVMLWLRKLFHSTSQQFHAILKRLRAKQLDPQLCTFAKRHKKFLSRRQIGKGGGSPVPVVTRAEVFAYLTSAGSLTHSEAFLFLEYCSVDSTASGTDDPSSDEEGMPQRRRPGAGGETGGGLVLDVDFALAALFEFPLPDDIAFPLLMAKFVEAVSDPYRVVSGSNMTTTETLPTLSRSGVTGIYEALRMCDTFDPAKQPLQQSQRPMAQQSQQQQQQQQQQQRGPSTVSTSSADDTDMSDFNRSSSSSVGGGGGGQDGTAAAADAVPWYYVSIRRNLLDEAMFRRLNFLICGGLPNKECDLLFSFLNDRATGLMPVSVLLEQYVMRLQPVAAQELQLWAANVRGSLMEQLPNGLNGLHLRLARFGDRRIPVIELSAAIRECGVPQAVAPDAVLDALLREAPTCGSFVLLLRGPLPPARSGIIRKLFAVLDTNRDGLVARDLVFSCFSTSVNGQQHGAEFGRGRDWKADLLAYLESLPRDDNISYAEFEYYWGNVAVSVEDDNTFTMLLWKAYAMHKPRGGPSAASGGSPMESRPVTPSRVREQHNNTASAQWGSYCLPQETASPASAVSRRLLR